MTRFNPILATDSYKIGHAAMYPEGTTAIYSYFEARKGAALPETVFFGLQALLDRFLTQPVTQADLDEAVELTNAHFGAPLLNVEGWQRIIDVHGGKLPLRIKAVPEGTVVPINNVMMTVENTDPELPWLTNFVESLLTHVWYPSTVASVSRSVKQVMAKYLDVTAENRDALTFMLHDFGYRGVSSHESAEMGGAGHLLNFRGTDTLPAMTMLLDHYDADLADLAFSVPATEHSVMTALGERGEPGVISQLLANYPTGILSVVADSYDYYRFVDEFVGVVFREQILAREGRFVVRPDSVTKDHPTPEALVEWTLHSLWRTIGGTTNSKGYKVLDDHVRVLWGDGIGPAGIERIMEVATAAGFSVENLVFGMGGGLLQKINRDTQRFAFKCSARRDENGWHDVWKKPLDISKASKAGRMSLIPYDHSVTTVAWPNAAEDLLQVVFENGEVVSRSTLAEARERAEVKAPALV